MTSRQEIEDFVRATFPVGSRVKRAEPSRRKLAEQAGVVLGYDVGGTNKGVSSQHYSHVEAIP